jgi:hypothetical protein
MNGATLDEFVHFSSQRLSFEIDTMQVFRLLLLTASPFEMWDALKLTVGYENGDLLTKEIMAQLSPRWDALTATLTDGK